MESLTQCRHALDNARRNNHSVTGRVISKKTATRARARARSRSSWRSMAADNTETSFVISLLCLIKVLVSRCGISRIVNCDFVAREFTYRC